MRHVLDRPARPVAVAVAAIAALIGSVLVTAAPAGAAEWPVTQDGQRGPNVSTVQHLLNQHGHTTDADGVFGPDTASGVTAFQEDGGLDADGIVGAQTWPELVVDVAEGSSDADAVNAAKVQLVKHGAELDIDGTFDSATADAVTAFQEAYDLPTSGAVDGDTWVTLVTNAGNVADYSLPIDKDVLPRDEYASPHHSYPAIDLPVATGTSVYAVNGGEATPIPDGGSCGYGVEIIAEDGGEYVYCHFDEPAVASGPVGAGELIGYSGNTGQSTGPHLHLQIKRSDGTLVCPQDLLLAIYDETDVPAIDDLPTSGCSYRTPEASQASAQDGVLADQPGR